MPGGKKKAKGKGKTLALNDFLKNEDGTVPAHVPAPAPSSSWAMEMENVDMDDGEELRPAFDRSKLPTAPKAARGSDVDIDQIPDRPPFTAYLGNLAYEVNEEKLQQLFEGRQMEVVNVRLPNESGRVRGFGYVEFGRKEDLITALTFAGEMFHGRKLRVDLAGGDRERGDNAGRSDRNDWRGGGGDPDRTEGDWRRRDPPAWNNDRGATSGFDDRSGYNDRGGDRYGDRYNDRGGGFGNRDRGFNDRGGDRDSFRDRRGFGSDRDGDRGYGGGRYGDRDGDRGGRYDRGGGRYNDNGGRDGDRYGRDDGFGGRDNGDRYDRRDGGRYDDRRGAAGGYDDRRGGGRYDDRGGGRYDDRRGDRYGGRSGGGFEDRGFGGRRGGERDYRRDDDGGRYGGYREDRGGSRDGSQVSAYTEGPRERPRLNLQPRTKPVETAPAEPSRQSSIFGSAKPVDTAAKEREIEEKLRKLDTNAHYTSEELGPRDRDGREGGRPRRDSDRSDGGRGGGRERRLSSSSSKAGASRRDSETSRTSDDAHPPERDSRPPARDERKMVPAPPPKENAWSRPRTEAISRSADVSRQVSSSSTGSQDSRDRDQDYYRRDNRRSSDEGRRTGYGRGNPGRGDRHEPPKNSKREKALPKSIDDMPKWNEGPGKNWADVNKYAVIMDDDYRSDED